MAYIKLNNNMPGIVGLLWTKPTTGKTLSKFAHSLIKGHSALSSGEKEMIASYVSYLNKCNFCCNSHSAAAACYYNGNQALIDEVKTNTQSAPVSDKMKMLLSIAAKVQQGGKFVLKEDIEAAKKTGITDDELHDTVLVAAAFCMFNRYVDGMGTKEPDERSEYKEMGERMSKQGYRFPNFILRKIINWQYTKKKLNKK